MTRLRNSPLLGATVLGIGGGLIFASLLLLLVPPTGIAYWGPVAIATAVALAAAFGSHLLGAPEHGEEGSRRQVPTRSASPPHRPAACCRRPTR